VNRRKSSSYRYPAPPEARSTTAASASHGLVVNGNNVGSVGYPVTGWDNWHESSVSVTLNAGWNTIRLTKGDLYTEVDYLEVQ
jgi:arabinan endo-1,5-alpha-L-arabinosidase